MSPWRSGAAGNSESGGVTIESSAARRASARLFRRALATDGELDPVLRADVHARRHLGDRARAADRLAGGGVVPGALALRLAQPLEVRAGPRLLDALDDGVVRHARDRAAVDLQREPLAAG